MSKWLNFLYFSLLSPGRGRVRAAPRSVHEPDEAQHRRLRVPAGQDLRQQEQHQRHPISVATTGELDQPTNQPAIAAEVFLKKGNYVTTTKSAKLTKQKIQITHQASHSIR